MLKAFRRDNERKASSSHENRHHDAFRYSVLNERTTFGHDVKPILIYHLILL